MLSPHFSQYFNLDLECLDFSILAQFPDVFGKTVQKLS